MGDNTVNLKEAQQLTFEEEQNLQSAFYSASIALEAFSEDDDEKQPVVDKPRMDVQAMSTMEVIEVIQTNPELGDIINDFLKQKQEQKSNRSSKSSNSKLSDCKYDSKYDSNR